METTDNILKSLFRSKFGVEPESVERLAGAGSSRRYFRLSGSGVTCIGVEGGNVAENQAFIYLAGHFRSRGINVPEVYAVSDDGRYYLQQDLGTQSLFDAVAAGRKKAQAEYERTQSEGRRFEVDAYSPEEEELLCRTIAKLPQTQFAGAEGLDFSRCFPVPRMSARSIMFDLNYFKYCYLLPSGLEYDEARLQDEFDSLPKDLLSEPFDTFMYRDFQTRNVMILGGDPWFMDFQGGRCGPIYYDVASFAWQARSCFPPQLRDKMISSYLGALQQYRPMSREQFMSRLRIFLLFRIMQVLGAYGFRGLYQRKPHFLQSIPYALGNLRELLAEPFAAYPYLSSLLLELCDKNPETGQTVEGESSSSQNVKVGEQKVTVATKDNMETKSVDTKGKTDVQSAGKVEAERLTVKITSFSYKAGIPQDDSGNGGGYVFDCRGMNNPGRYERYRHSTGRDADVIEFIETDGGVFRFLDGVYAMVDPHVENFLARGFTSLCVNFGCTGGQHRSVYCAEALAKHIAEKFPSADILLRHTKLGLKRKISHQTDSFENK
ncbi:MAG: phosphotransferase [Bacteroidales bacterium]|nr:phosphotransferase [Bacteroidales bacterium]